MSENNATIKIIMLSIIGLIIVAVLGFVFIKPIIIKNHLPNPVTIDTTNQPTLGKASAKIHIVAFEDLKCMNCARFNREVMPKIETQYIKTGDANYTLINLAFVEGSLPAANAARCVYMQNKALFFDYVQYIFEHQPPENENWATVPTLLDMANHVSGINTDALAQCIVKSPYDQFFQNNLTIAAKLMNGAVSTPSVYINGILVTPPTFAQIQKVIRAVE